MSKRSIIAAASLCLGLGLLATSAPSVDAAVDHEFEAGSLAPSGIELIAFESSNCRYCPVFRREVASSYAASRPGRMAPLRVVDVNEIGAESFDLAGPITVVPTLVLVRDGVEIGRISGYFGRENTYRMLDTLLPPD